MEGANISLARMEGANLSRVRMDGARSTFVRFEGANLREVRMGGASLFEARLEGADLTLARMEATYFREVTMDEHTDLSGASVRGAALRCADYSSVSLSVHQITSTFGDASVTLPGGVTHCHPDWPAHWPVWELPEQGPGPNFLTEYDRWLADPANYVSPPPPDAGP